MRLVSAEKATIGTQSSIWVACSVSKAPSVPAVREVSFSEAAIIVICVTIGMVGGVGGLFYLVQLME